MDGAAMSPEPEVSCAAIAASGSDVRRAGAAVALVLWLLASVACSRKLSRVVEFDVGVPLSTIVEDVGSPDRDQPLAGGLRASRLCPATTTRLVEYHRRPWLPIIDHGDEVSLCVDGAARVVEILSTGPY
jgi:hypothetical protein